MPDTTEPRGMTHADRVRAALGAMETYGVVPLDEVRLRVGAARECLGPDGDLFMVGVHLSWAAAYLDALTP